MLPSSRNAFADEGTKLQRIAEKGTLAYLG